MIIGNLDRETMGGDQKNENLRDSSCPKAPHPFCNIRRIPVQRIPVQLERRLASRTQMERARSWSQDEPSSWDH
jgi:hypothetical protein